MKAPNSRGISLIKSGCRAKEFPFAVRPSVQAEENVRYKSCHSLTRSLPSLFDPRPGPNQSRKEGGDIALPGGPTRRTTPSGRTWRTTTSTPLWLSLKYRFSPSQPNSVRSKSDRTAGCYLRNSEKGQVPRRTLFLSPHSRETRGNLCHPTYS